MTSSDQLGNKITLKQSPSRIISLVPSQSEYLWDLGLDDRLVGITKFCVHPDVMFKKVKRLGGTKDLNIPAIRALKPDLIIGNKEENDKTQIETLANEFPVWMSDINTLSDAFAMMRTLARLLDKKEEGKELIKESKRALQACKNSFLKKRVAYFIWRNPYLFAGKNTFIHEMLVHCGLSNTLADRSRYPELSLSALARLNPDYCFLSSEPYPFQQKHVVEIQRVLPHTKVILVDGEIFSWYGSRLRHVGDYINELTTKLQV